MDERRGTFIGGVVLLVLAFLLLTRCGGSNTDKVGAVPNGQGRAEATPIVSRTSTPPGDRRTGGTAARSSAARTTPPAEPTRAAAQASQTDQGTASVTVDGEPLFPLSRADGVDDDGDLTGLRGERVVAWQARVLTVPADEGFWIGTGRNNRIWVQLTGPPPESPYTVLPGDTVSFTARFVPHGAGYARRVGVSAAEGSALLTRERQHVDVPKRTLSLFHRP